HRPHLSFLRSEQGKLCKHRNAVTAATKSFEQSCGFQGCHSFELTPVIIREFFNAIVIGCSLSAHDDEVTQYAHERYCSDGEREPQWGHISRFSRLQWMAQFRSQGNTTRQGNTTSPHISYPQPKWTAGSL